MEKLIYEKKCSKKNEIERNNSEMINMITLNFNYCQFEIFSQA